MSDDAKQQLVQYRTQIDAIDQQLIALLKQRTLVVQQVGALKQAHWPGRCHIRPAREAQMHGSVFKAFAGSDFLPEAAVAIWRHIISASTHIESPLCIAVAAELRALAQGYFGDYVNYAPLAAVLPDSANIAILPFPNAGNAPLWAEFIAANKNWRVFAYLPVVLSVGNAPQALALAPLQCEASGDDISYFYGGNIPAEATKHGDKIWSLPGFVTEYSGAEFIGAHGVPINLTDEHNHD